MFFCDTGLITTYWNLFDLHLAKADQNYTQLLPSLFFITPPYSFSLENHLLST